MGALCTAFSVAVNQWTCETRGWLIVSLTEMFLHAALPIAADMKETFFFPIEKCWESISILWIINPSDGCPIGCQHNDLGRRPTVRRLRRAIAASAAPSRITSLDRRPLSRAERVDGAGEPAGRFPPPPPPLLLRETRLTRLVYLAAYVVTQIRDEHKVFDQRPGMSFYPH